MDKHLFDDLTAAERFGVDLNEIVEQPISPKDLCRSLFGDPRDLGVRKARPNRGQSGERMDNVTDRPEFYDQNLQPVFMLCANCSLLEMGLGPMPRPGARAGQKLLEI